MTELILKNIESICPADMVTVIGKDESAIEKEPDAENVTVVYFTQVGGIKGYHFLEWEEEKIKYNSDIFPIEGSEIFKIDSTPLARIHGTVIYLLFEPGSEAFLRFVLTSVIQQPMELVKEKRKQNFKNAFSNAIEVRVKEFKDNIEINEDDAQTKERELKDLYKKIEVDKRALISLEGTKGEWKQKGGTEYEQLRKLVPNLYSSIYVSDNTLVALTHLVEITYNRSRYDIGEFEIRIKLDTGDVTISNQTNKVDDEYDHPHIFNGVACLGNIGKGILRMLAEFELFGTLQVIHTFLHSYNPDSPHKKIEFWDPDYEDEEENRYDRCRENNSGYACVECGDSDCPFYEEAFNDCSEDADYNQCRRCDYLCRLGKERIKREESEGEEE
jgi:hypothetical protein